MSRVGAAGPSSLSYAVIRGATSTEIIRLIEKQAHALRAARIELERTTKEVDGSRLGRALQLLAQQDVDTIERSFTTLWRTAFQRVKQGDLGPARALGQATGCDVDDLVAEILADIATDRARAVAS